LKDQRVFFSGLTFGGRTGLLTLQRALFAGIRLFRGRSMSDYLADVRRYDAAADEAHVAKIVKYLGIALRNKDSSLVSCANPDELARVREKWCKRNLLPRMITAAMKSLPLFAKP
jgi:hypothetical protein